jgi:transketolase
VIDLYSVKPIDVATLKTAAVEAGGKFFVVEDHWPEGGLGDAVLEVFGGADGVHPNVIRLAVKAMPTSGTPADMMDAAGISAPHIVDAVRAAVKK